MINIMLIQTMYQAPFTVYDEGMFAGKIIDRSPAGRINEG